MKIKLTAKGVKTTGDVLTVKEYHERYGDVILWSKDDKPLVQIRENGGMLVIDDGTPNPISDDWANESVGLIRDIWRELNA